MRVALVCAGIAALLAACSATTEPVESTGDTAPPLSTTVSTTTTVAVVESGDLWYDDLFDAWDSGDLDTYEAAFAEGALFDGRIVGSPTNDEVFAFLMAARWRSMYRDCVHHAPAYATCDVVWIDDFHGPGGVTTPATAQIFFDDDHRIISYSSGLNVTEMTVFEETFADFVNSEHSKEAVDLLWPSSEWDIDALRGRIALVPEFLAWSDTYPLDQPPDVAEPVLTGSVEGVDLYNAEEGQIALVAWALGQYRDSGLPLPPVTHVTFPPTASCLRGVFGMAYHGDESGHIDLCAPETLFVGDGLPLATRRTVLHELGHLWTVGHVDEATRQAFLDHLGLPAWSGVEWGSSGSEAAAEILVWGLMDDPIDVRVPGTSCAERYTAFEILTGAPPPQRSCEGS
ncbi:hypothetical protein ACFLQ7_01650 [Actinomycetota bacterium]